MINEAAYSIKTVDVTGHKRESTNSTVSKTTFSSGPLTANKVIFIPCESKYSFELHTSTDISEVIEVESVAGIGVSIGKIKDFLGEALQRFRFPNAVGDVEPIIRDFRVLCQNQPMSCSRFSFFTSPLSSAFNITDKKYSEVFQEVHSLRQPEDPDDPVPADFSYWNALRVLADAYHILRTEYPRSIDLVQPTAVVDSAGGVRLIWKTEAKQVKANFGARPDLKSYLYFESGQVYDVEALDALTLAHRLGWLV